MSQCPVIVGSVGCSAATTSLLADPPSVFIRAIRIASPGSRAVTRTTESPNLGPDPASASWQPGRGPGGLAGFPGGSPGSSANCWRVRRPASRTLSVRSSQRRFQSSAESPPYAQSSSSAMFGADHRHDGGLRPFRHTQMAGGSYMSSKLLADFLTFTNLIYALTTSSGWPRSISLPRSSHIASLHISLMLPRP